MPQRYMVDWKGRTLDEWIEETLKTDMDDCSRYMAIRAALLGAGASWTVEKEGVQWLNDFLGGDTIENLLLRGGKEIFRA